HPLELTDVLNGFSGNGVEGDQTAWAAMLPEWDLFLEWLVANRQNSVEWVLLSADSWSEFAESPVRQQRLRTLVEHAHAYGIAAGIDAPIAQIQQHSYRLIRSTGTLEEEVAQIHAHLDWLMGSGFDFFSSESGTTEFTHPTAERTLAWMDEVARYVDTRWHSQ